ncbi:MAG: cytochrome c maturation protein CcmE [Pseudomonadota bacterium]
MKPKQQRLILAIIALVAIVGSGLLAMSAIGDRASYFYSPADIAKNGIPQGQAIRLGGMVMKNSIFRAPDGVTITFIVHDGPAEVNVRFKGIPPDLFREGSGVVAEGMFEGRTFVATNLLAKHDERYMPPQMDGKQHKTTTLAQ